VGRSLDEAPPGARAGAPLVRPARPPIGLEWPRVGSRFSQLP